MVTLFILLTAGLVFFILLSILGIVMLPFVGVFVMIAFVFSIIGIIFKIMFSKAVLITIIVLGIIYYRNNKNKGY